MMADYISVTLDNKIETWRFSLGVYNQITERCFSEICITVNEPFIVRLHTKSAVPVMHVTLVVFLPK